MPPGLTSPVHLLIVLVVALIVLGPEQLPGALRQVGRFLGEVQQWSARLREQMDTVVAFDPEAASPTASSGEQPEASAVPGLDGAAPRPDTPTVRQPPQESP